MFLFALDLFGYRHTLRPILDQLIGDSKHVIPLTVDRENVFRQAISFYKTSKAGKHTQLLITFRSGGVEEQGYDGAGTNLMRSASRLQVCHGTARK